MITEIYKLADKVRDHIKNHRYQSVLVSESDVWNQICSSLDVIDDTLSAISSYLETDFPSENGEKYIFIYGVLQALFIQQDALKNLSEAFEINYCEDEKLKFIREIRNASIGHPTKLTRNKSLYYFQIARHSISRDGFELLQYSGTRTNRIQVNLGDLVEQQLEAIKSKYQIIVTTLKEMDEKHKKEFDENSLQDIFHSGMSYSFQKVSSGLISVVHDNKEWGRANLGIITDTYNKFKDGLIARRELNKYIEYDLDQFFHALKRLEEFYETPKPWMTKYDALIYIDYIINQHDEFVNIAKEIDQSYKTKNT